MIDVMNGIRSPPARVAWIEIIDGIYINQQDGVATREGGVDRNTSEKLYSDDGVESPPARVAWIEIRCVVMRA